jgi:hypothetical protein
VTLHEEIGLTAIIYEPLVIGGGSIFVADANITSYTHTISANGGFDSMTIGIADDRLSLDEWIEKGIARHIEIYSQTGVLVFEGFVNVIRGAIGAYQVSVGALMDIGNRVSVAYAPVYTDSSPPSVGAQTVTTVADDDTSQERYGIIEKVINGGRVTDTEAELIRDTYLKEQAYPATASEVSVGSSAQPSVTLECLGYWYWTNCYVYNDTDSGTIQVDERIPEIIEDDPNSFFPSPVVDTNNSIVPEESDEDKIAMAHLKELLALGGASDQRYTLGFYADRKAYYREVPSTVAYKMALSDQGQKIKTFEGALVYPWDIRPAQWIFISDALIGRYTGADLYEDPRYMFIEQVNYTAPWNVRLTGSRVSTFAQIMAKFGLGDF